MGIQDKQLICVIGKMLKAPILTPEGDVIYPTKGTPQGGILSPLLSNTVLNELDWWIAKQWEEHPTHYNYKYKGDKYSALKKTNLKEIFLVRYADDFKIFCKDYKTAQKIFIATKKWLYERLNLEISNEKSKIVNLRKRHSEFLGFKIRVNMKRNKFITQSNISDKAKQNILNDLRVKIRQLGKSNDANEVNKFNSTIIGLHNYYKIASNISVDFKDIAYLVKRELYNSTKNMRSKSGTISKTFSKYYGKYNYKITYLKGIALFPINGVSYKPAMNFDQDISNYTKSGRIKVHNNIKDIDLYTLRYLMNNPIVSQSVEYNDNRISLYVGQKGRCYISGMELEIGSMEVHHKIPRVMNGLDKYDNLAFVHSSVHKLIHATNEETIRKYSKDITIEGKQLIKLNKLRRLVGNEELTKIDLY